MLKRPDSPIGDDRSGAPSPNPGGALDIREALHFVWRRWTFIAVVTALAILIGELTAARQTPLYTATAELLLDPRKEKAVGQDPILTDLTLDIPTVESQIALIRSTSLMRRVVVRERLSADPEFGARSAEGGGPIASLGGLFARPPAPEPSRTDAPGGPGDEIDTPADVEETVQALTRAVEVKRVGQALVLDVSFTSADPAKAARLANAVADAYVVDKLDARFEAAKRASSWLSDRLVDLKRRLRDSEEAVARFRAENNLVGGAGGANASPNQDQISQLNVRMVAARAQTAESKARLDLLQKGMIVGGSVNDLSDLGGGAAMSELRRQENALTRELADLRVRDSVRHPSVVSLGAQLADVRRLIALENQRLAAEVEHDYDLALARQQAIERTLRDVTGESDLDATKTITLRELERNAAVDKTLFEDFLQRAKITEEQSTFEARDARIITLARPPVSPSSPRTALIVAASSLLGLMVGTGGALLIETFHSGFTTPGQVEALLDLPLIGSISRMRRRDLVWEGRPIALPEYPLVKPLSGFSEAFRSLRSALQMSDVGAPPKVLMVTSTVPSEGKTMIAMTIATSGAQGGQRVLLVDADLRRASARRNRVDGKGPGLVDCLVGDVDLATVVARDERLKISVLPAGGKTQNPADLLGSDRFRALLAQLKESYDLIVIDTSPIGPVVDALMVAQVADRVVFVVRWAATARETVARAIETIPGQTKIAGLVFNFVVDSLARKYDKYALSYYRGGRSYQKYYTE